MKAIIREPLILPRYEDMTFEELLQRAQYARETGNGIRDNATARKWYRAAMWILEMAARKVG